MWVNVIFYLTGELLLFILLSDLLLFILLGELLWQSSFPRFCLLYTSPTCLLTRYKFVWFCNLLPCYCLPSWITHHLKTIKEDICNNNNFIGRKHDKFKRASDKNSHQKSYNCLKCHHSLQIKDRLNSHQWSCNDVKPVYSCQVCGNAFTRLITNNDILRLVCLGRGKVSLLPVIHAVAVEKYSLIELIYIIIACCIMLRRYPKVIQNEP